ncbi:hypothetical protein ACU610_21255 [Geodermatophilus sp. URMC 61]|uniref:hypothetical protein n=1 Tax=Geodermatophilus sp. URMC 61 TaxID=3423411 RepID=UPI00406CB431
MTTTTTSQRSAAVGELVTAERLVAGQCVYTRPLARSGMDWCEVRGSKRGRDNIRLALTRRDGKRFLLAVRPEVVFRTLDGRPVPTVVEADLANARLASGYPATRFRVRPSAGEVSVTWTDGPSVATVLASLATAGVAHPYCRRDVSGAMRATAVVRQAREGSLADHDRHQRLLEDLEAFTADERRLGIQLHRFADSDDRLTLAAKMREYGLLLADTAGVACPEPIRVCCHCHRPPQFTVRRLWHTDSTLSCAACLPRTGREDTRSCASDGLTDQHQEGGGALSNHPAGPDSVVRPIGHPVIEALAE